MIRTALFKALDHLWERLVEEFRAAELWNVVAPAHPLVSVRSGTGCYCIDFSVVADRGIHLRLTFELEKELAREVVEGAAAETARVIGRVRAGRGEVLRMLESAERLARCRFEAAEAGGRGARLIGARLAPLRVDRPGEPLAVEIVYEGLDDRLRPARRTILLAAGAEEPSAVDRGVEEQARRATRWRLVADAGGVGLVDTVSLSAIDAFAEDRRKFLRRVVEDRSTMLHVPYGHGSSHAVQWRHGVAGVTVRTGRELTFGRGIAFVRRGGRDVDAAALPGAALASVVAHALLPEGLLITGARWDEGWPELRPPPDDQTLVLTYREPLRVFDQRGEVVGPPVGSE